MFHMKRLEGLRIQKGGDKMINAISKRFSRPKGLIGVIAGYIMAAENKTLNKWTIDQLTLKRHDVVLEVGYGPGYSLKQMLKREPTVKIDGIDASGVMKKQAERKVKQRSVRLMKGGIETVPLPSAYYDKVLSVNNYTIWNDRQKGVNHIYQALKPGGKTAISMQPREADASPEKTKAFAKQIYADLYAAGFEDIEIQFKYITPELSVCVTAKKPGI